jgi:hypothetical protein
VVAGGRSTAARREHAIIRSRLGIEYTFVSNGRVEVRRCTRHPLSTRRAVESAGFTIDRARPWNRDLETVSFIATRG